jgi:glycine/serine hydroxymethyltransferase
LPGTGTPALTSRGFTEEDFEKVAEYFDRAVEIAVKVKKSSGETSSRTGFGLRFGCR